MTIEKSYITYWQELIERNDPQALHAEANVMFRMVGLSRIFQLVVNDELSRQEAQP